VPDLRVVIDHCAKPVIAGGADPGAAWRAGMTRLAEAPQVHCKLSGLATEAGAGWDAAILAPVADFVIETFGPDRVMWGSDWPVLELVASYGEWVAVTDTLVTRLSDADRAAILGGTATAFYGLETPT